MDTTFDTSVQELKYKVLKEIAKGLFNDTWTLLSAAEGKSLA